jgi:hypothetical protein
MKLNDVVTRDQTVMVFKPTNEVFYEDEMDSGGRLYLSLVGTGTPMFFGRRRTKVNIGWSNEIVFRIPYGSIPVEDRQYSPPSNGFQEADTHEDKAFIKKYIEIVKVTVTIAKQENV